MRIRLLAALALAGGCTGADDVERTPTPANSATDEPAGFYVADAGLDVVPLSGGPAKRYIIEANGSGVCSLDYDRDGDEDLYVVSGATLASPATGRSTLYRNRGDGRFDNVSDGSGTGHDGWGFGCAVADYDQDGWPDLVVTAWGPDRLYRNRGDGTFEEVSARAGLTGTYWGEAASFGDYDRDGLPDLYVTNYIAFDPSEEPPGPEVKGYRGLRNTFKGPRGLTPEPDQLYRNRGDGTFEDVSTPSHIRRDVADSYGLAVAWVDIDRDGWLDILVANDSMANFVLVNQRDGRFRELGVPMGFSFSDEGAAQASMGIAWGDVDENGWDDAMVTNFSEDKNTLYLFDGMAFRDATFEAGLVTPTWLRLGWATMFLDFDHDRHLDLFVANGHVYPQIDGTELDISYAQPDDLFRGDGTGKLTRQEAGDLGRVAGVSRGAAAGDFDLDGDLDIVVVQLDAKPILYENRAAAGGWVEPLLMGRSADRDALGATATLHVGTARLRRTVLSGGTYASSSQLRLHFGVGDARGPFRLDVDWTDGTRETFEVEAGSFPTIVQGTGRPSEKSRPAAR